MHIPVRPRLVLVLTLLTALAYLPFMSSTSSTSSTDWYGHEAQAEMWWGVDGPALLAGFHNGQCTDLAARRRPDIVEEADERVYARWLTTGERGPLGIDWYARDWARNAAKAGFTIGHRPRPGSLVVFQSGVYQAAKPYGHVAVVVGVEPRGGFIVREEYAPELWRVTSRSFTAGQARAMSSDPRVQFIY